MNQGSQSLREKTDERGRVIGESDAGIAGTRRAQIVAGLFRKLELHSSTSNCDLSNFRIKYKEDRKAIQFLICARNTRAPLCVRITVDKMCSYISHEC